MVFNLGYMGEKVIESPSSSSFVSFFIFLFRFLSFCHLFSFPMFALKNIDECPVSHYKTHVLTWLEIGPYVAFTVEG